MKKQIDGGILGIAVFFIRKMVKNSVPPPRPARVRQPARPVASATNVSVSHVNFEAPPVDGYPLRDASAVSSEFLLALCVSFLTFFFSRIGRRSG